LNVAGPSDGKRLPEPSCPRDALITGLVWRYAAGHSPVLSILYGTGDATEGWLVRRADGRPSGLER
jgi:hypothetical protein